MPSPFKEGWLSLETHNLQAQPDPNPGKKLSSHDIHVPNIQNPKKTSLCPSQVSNELTERDQESVVSEKTKEENKGHKISSAFRFVSQAEKNNHFETKRLKKLHKSRSREATQRANQDCPVFMHEGERLAIRELLNPEKTQIEWRETNKFNRMHESEIKGMPCSNLKQSMVALGFQENDVDEAMMYAHDRATLLDWLCFNVSEEHLPSQFNPRGRQLEVIVSATKQSPSGPLGSITGVGFPEAMASIFLNRFENSTLALLHLHKCTILPTCARIRLNASEQHQFRLQVEDDAQLESKMPLELQNRNMQSSTVDAQADAPLELLEEIESLKAIFDQDISCNIVAFPESSLCRSLTEIKIRLRNCSPSLHLPEAFFLIPHSNWPLLGSPHYPCTPPIIYINDKKISNCVRLSIAVHAASKAIDMIGFPMIYSLVEWLSTNYSQLQRSKLFDDWKISPVSQNIACKTRIAWEKSKAEDNNAKKSRGNRKNRSTRYTKTLNQVEDENVFENAEITHSMLQWKTSAEGIQVEAKRAQLPIAATRSNIISAIKSSLVTIITGETGSGKTTQVPQYLLEDAIECRNIEGCEIVCTQVSVCVFFLNH